MKIEKNRIKIILGSFCNYCGLYWDGMNMEEMDIIYYNPTDNSVLCKACHKAYGPADSKVEAE